MTNGWISGLLRRFFLVCTNFSPMEQGGRGWEGGDQRREPDFHTATFSAGEATKSSHIEPIPHHKAREASS